MKVTFRQDNVDMPMQWFAMRATYHREMLAKQLLEQRCIECYVPLHSVLKESRGRKVRMKEPVVSSLLFAHALRNDLQLAKSKIPFLQYMTTVEGTRRVPIVVPDYQMRQFMRATSVYDEQLTFLSPEQVDLKQGTPVRIHGGVFDGMEGRFMKIKGKRNKRVVVSIQNVIAVAIAYVDPDYIEIL